MQTTRPPLRRSRANALIGGVASALAAYLRLDPALVRLAWVLSLLFGGFGVLLYLIAWVVIPDEDGRHDLLPLLMLAILILLPALVALSVLLPVTSRASMGQF